MWVNNGTLIEVVRGIGIDELEWDVEVGVCVCVSVCVEVSVSVSVYVIVYVFRNKVIVVVTNVFSVMGSRPSARKLDSISSSLGVLLVEVLGRFVCVEGSSCVIGGSCVCGWGSNVWCDVVVVSVSVSVSDGALELLSTAGAELL